MTTTVFINEIHYDNTGTDTGEAIEIAGPAGTDLTGWSIVLYNGATTEVYDTVNLSGSIPNQGNGFGTVVETFPTNGIQNGSPDGIALVDSSGSVIEFLSYEGSFTASNGPAAGLTSTDIGVSEGSSTPIGASLQLTGTGTTAADFSWTETTTNTFGAINQGQSFSGTVEPTAPLINEFVFNHTGTDTSEYVEIFADPNTDYSGFSLLQIEGDGSNAGVIDSVFQIGTTDANGFWTTGFQNNEFENGTVSLLLVENFTGSLGDDLDTDNDGTVDSQPWENLVDDVAVNDGDGGDQTYANVVLTPGFDGISFTPGGASRIPNGTDTDTPADWVRNDFDGEGIPGLPGSPEAGEALNTPGAVNELIAPPLPPILINEIDADNPGTDSVEFIELFDGGVGNTSLDGLVLVLYNGNGDAVYDAIDLDGFATDANGFFVVGSANVPNVDLVAFTTNGLQNGADAVALYLGDAADFPDGTPVTTNNLIDAIVYDTNDTDDSGLLPLLNSGQPQVNEGGAGDSTRDSLQRIPNGEGGARNTDTFEALAPTPGAENMAQPPEMVAIYEIQGAAQTSSLVGQLVITTGIVTAVDSNGFYLQDANGDGVDATSDGIFVFTGGNPGVSVGDELQVEGAVSEFIPGGASTGNLSITQISGDPTITTLSTGNALPAAVILGAGGRIPPNQIIDNDPLSEYEPTEDGIDFYESVEGMRVTINDALAVSGTNRFGEIFTVADNGANATGLSSRGTINISPEDFNPERIQIQFDSGILPNFEVEVDAGAQLGDVTGVVGYNFGNFEVNVTEPFAPIANSNLQPETSNLTGTDDQLTVASYNVLNLDPNDSDGDTDIADGRFEAIAAHIANNLNLPDIIGLQEVQDNNGSEISDITAADETLQLLIDEIEAISGVTYEFIDNPFIGNETSGGQPGGNIRTAFLYNPNRVDFIEGSLQTVTDPIDQRTNPNNPFFDTRLPLAANFLFNGQEVTVVDNHFSSKGGSSPLFGQNQPSVTNEPNSGQEDPNINGSLDERQAQAQAVKDFVDGILANDPNANVTVLGDFNEFEFISPLDNLEQSLTNLTETLPENERYTFIFQGNSQSLDHILVSDSLDDGAEFDIVHVNIEFAETPQRASDHDPLLVRLTLAQQFNEILGTAGRDNLVGTAGSDRIIGLQGRDTLTGGGDSDRFVYTSVVDGGDIITDFEVGSDEIVLTEVLDSLGYDGTDAIADGYVQFGARGSDTLVQLDPDGFAGAARVRSFILVEDVSATALNDASNFVF